MPDQVLYCTGEIMDITPLRIAKFNELGDDNIYFRNYTTAINNFKKYGTDMWNPHLGNNLHKRGYLPYMNEQMEKECDIKVVKALLYGFYKEHITFKASHGEVNAKRNFYFNHNNRKITDTEGRWVKRENIAQLMSWIRNEDELVDEWSEAFDKDLQRSLNGMPSLAGDNEIGKLKSHITTMPFMKLLTDKLFRDDSVGTIEGINKPVEVKDGKLKTEKRVGPTAIEFAYMIKTSEEIGRDCDDAERILEVLYDTFYKICAYRTNPATNPECFIALYKHELDKIYTAVAASQLVFSAGAEAEAIFNIFTLWLNQAGTFRTISDDVPMDDRGNVCIETPYAPLEDAKRLIDAIKQNKKAEEKEAKKEAKEAK